LEIGLVPGAANANGKLEIGLVPGAANANRKSAVD